MCYGSEPMDRSEAPIHMPHLGPLEQRVMDVAWRSEVVSVRDVADALREHAEPAYTTVMTIMTRLMQKGLLEREARGRAYVYRPTMSQQSYEQALSRERVRGLIEEFGDIAVMQFAEELRDTDPESARRLGELLRKRPRK